MTEFADDTQAFTNRRERPARLERARVSARAVKRRRNSDSSIVVVITRAPGSAARAARRAQCVGGWRDAEVGEQKAGADARGFKDHRQTAAGMRAAADEVNAIDILEAVVRPEVQHLVEAVREIEGRALMDLIFRVPVVGRDDALEADAPLDIGEAGLRDLPQHFRAERARARATNRRSDAGA